MQLWNKLFFVYCSYFHAASCDSSDMDWIIGDSTHSFGTGSQFGMIEDKKILNFLDIGTICKFSFFDQNWLLTNLFFLSILYLYCFDDNVFLSVPF